MNASTTFAPTTAGQFVDPAAGASHSPDFTWVNWFGTKYYFHGSAQRAVIAVLWSAWQSGEPDVCRGTLLKVTGTTDDLRDMFRTHTAWGAMIRPSSLYGGMKGCYRLVGPSESIG